MTFVLPFLRFLLFQFCQPCGSAIASSKWSFDAWSKIGFAVMFITGSLLLVTQAGKAYGNAFFRAKLIFLLLLGINAAVYQKVFYPKMAQWDSERGAPAGAKFCAGFSLLLWIGIIVCGRTMAYQF